MQMQTRPTETTGQRVIRVIAETLESNPANIQPDNDVRLDIGCDSLDCVEIMMALENEFAIEIDDGQFDNLRTVQDIINYVIDARTTANPQHIATDRLAQAQQIAVAASYLDDQKHNLAPESREIAETHSTNLHQIAKRLAGARVEDIYGPNDDTAEAAQIRAMETSGGPGWAAI